MARKGPKWEAGDTDYYRAIVEQNPWQATGAVPTALAPPTERPLAQALWRRLKVDQPSRFQIVLGPRRVGKSTVMYQSVRALLGGGVSPSRLWWLRLDHPMLMRRSLDATVRLLLDLSDASGEKPLYLFLDELTYATDWDLWLKTFYDQRYPVRLVGTSSATAMLRDRRLESGIGRWDEQYLAPYLLPEYLDLKGAGPGVAIGETLAETLESLTDWAPLASDVAERRRRYLLTGGFPELLLALQKPDADDETRVLESQRTLRTDAIERAVYKDIPQAYGVDRPMLLERMLYVLAEQMTGLLAPTSICRELDGMSAPTFEKYLSYLQHAFLVFTLPNYSGSERGVQKRYRKLYFVDGAVRSAALQRGLRPLSDPGEMALLLENAAAAHLHALAQQSHTRLYHWRDGNAEVDLVLDDPRAPLAFEIASSSSHHRRGLQGLIARHDRFRNRSYIIAPDAPAVPAPLTDDGIGSAPLDAFLIALGLHAQHELNRRLAV